MRGQMARDEVGKNRQGSDHIGLCRQVKEFGFNSNQTKKVRHVFIKQNIYTLPYGQQLYPLVFI